MEKLINEMHRELKRHRACSFVLQVGESCLSTSLSLEKVKLEIGADTLEINNGVFSVTLNRSDLLSIDKENYYNDDYYVVNSKTGWVAFIAFLDPEKKRRYLFGRNH